MGELDEIRKKKMEELKRKQDDEQQTMEAEVQRQLIFQQVMAPEARERLTRIKMANPEYAAQVENVLLQLIQQGRIKTRITEEMLKQILSQLQGQKKDFKITRR
jgi:programmed cell death protein 5